MKRLRLLLAGAACLLISHNIFGQDFSNKGKEFWLAYSYHVGMAGGGNPTMTLYITSDQNTSYQVEIFPGNIIGSGNIFAGQVAQVTIPTSLFVNGGGLFNDKAIRVSSQKPSVVYSYITRSQASGATLCLPTTVLGREYYSMNFTQVSNEPNSNSYFTIVAVEDNTQIEITPSANTTNGWTAGNTYTVSLNKGQIYQVLGTVNGNNGVDLTGSHIKSISSTQGGCKKIAVFSGSGKIRIPASGCGNNSSDNLYQQLYPVGSWGKRYLTVPSANNPNNYYRIAKSDPNANVYVNGTLVNPALFVNGIYYQFFNNVPNLIESDLPISVTQYFTTQNCDGNGSPYDPDMIVLNPVEQNINNVTLVSSNLYAPGAHQHHLHVIMRNAGTGIPSFKLDGAAVATNLWVPHPADPSYSYLYLTNVSQGYHTLQSDSGFNALAYGYGNAESYGYSAGANVKDLYQFITIQNQYATVNFPSSCRDAPFFFSIVFPYEPTQIQWIFGAALNAFGIADVTINNPSYDSTWVVNGRPLYRYKLPTPYTIPTAGTYPVQVIALNPTPGGCSGEQEIDFDLQVFDPPTSGFTFNTNGCITSPVLFFDTTNTGGRPIIEWQWNFGDNTTGGTQNPIHQYTSPGTYNVSLQVITDVGCISDISQHAIDLTTSPSAKFGNTSPTCAGKPIVFSDSSIVSGTGTIVKWTWNFGDGSPQVVATTNVSQTHTYTNPGTYNATLVVETNTGCVSQVFQKQIIIRHTPLASFNVPGVCLPQGTANFVNNSTIGDGSQGLMTYQWDFGDGNSSTQANPVHQYLTGGPFTVSLTAISNYGCTDDTIRQVTEIYAQPDASFTVDSVESCLGGTFNFTDQSVASNSSVTQWFWNFGDGTTSNLQNPVKQYGTPGTYTVTLYINSAAGCRSDTASMNVTVLQLPTASFTAGNLLCASQPIQLTSTSNPNVGVITQYSWTVNGTPSGGNNPQIIYTPSAAGNLNIGLSIITDKGCSAQTSAAILVNETPQADFTIPNICLPAGLAIFTNTSTIAGGLPAQLSYQWNFGNGQISTLQNPSTNYSGMGPYPVTLIASSTQGCSDTIVKQVNTIFAEPLASFNAPAEVCLGNAASFTDQSSAANSTVAQWFWDFGDGTTSTVQNPVKTYSNAATYQVTLTIVSAVGCTSAVFSKNIVVNPLPTVNFTETPAKCVGRNILFTDQSLANAGVINSWIWNFGDGGNSTVQNPVHSYNSIGNYNVTLQVQTNKGCTSAVFTKPITVHVNPEAGFISPEVCLLDPAAPFIDTSKISPGSIATWEWNFGDPNASPGNPNSSTIQNPTHAYTVVGNYTATLIVTSNQGCKDTVSNSFIVNGSVPQAQFIVQNPSGLCSNESVTIIDNSSVDFGSLIRVEIYWDYLNDPTIKTVDLDPMFGKQYTHLYPEFGTPATRTYTIRMISYSGINCLNITDKIVTILATPSLFFNAVPELCSNEPAFQISQAGISNGLTGSAVFSGNGVTPAGYFDPMVSGEGSHTIRYTFTASNGCENFAEQQIVVNPTPVANAGPDKVVLEGGTVMLTPALNSNFPVNYLWSPATGLNDPNRPDASSSPVADITYTLTVTSDKGCFTTDQVNVKVLLKPQIPNIFSPNGDGVHDKWIIEFLDTYPGCTVEIYNRYGQMVFRSIGYQTPWDGSINGKPMPIGTYYYIVDPKNGRQKMTGYVEIIR